VRRPALLLVATIVFAAAVAASSWPAPIAAGAAPASSAAKAERVAAPAHTIFFLNATGQTAWLASWPGSTTGQTGWKVGPHAGGSFEVPAGWNARVWGRTGCHFGAGEGGCRTGDCDGRFQCLGWGEIPATLAEFNLDSFARLDFYDVSMVDGSNLPMYVRVIHGVAEKSVDANGCLRPGVCTKEVRCPKALRVPRRGGPTVGCISPCARFGTDRYCCRGAFAAHCSPARTWPVDYAKVFKRAEPFAYSWSGDDKTGVFTCKGGCDYEVVFGISPPGADAPPG
jgi:Thaumatin family